MRRILPLLGKFATLAAIALLAWLGARAYWDLATPATPLPAIVVDTDALRVARAVASRHLFGEAPELPAGGAGPKVAADLRLQGVFAPAKQGRTAFAILSNRGKPAIAVREGDEVVPGVTLHRVLPRSVEIDQGGQIITLAFPERAKPVPTNPVIPRIPRRRPTS